MFLAKYSGVPALGHLKRSGVRVRDSKKHVGRDHNINQHFKEREKLMFRLVYERVLCFWHFFPQSEKREGKSSGRNCRVRK